MCKCSNASASVGGIVSVRVSTDMTARLGFLPYLRVSSGLLARVQTRVWLQTYSDMRMSKKV